MQHDYIFDDEDGLQFLLDVNNFALAIATQNSGSSAPAVTYAYMLWADTSAGLIKRRNSSNTAWLVIGNLGGASIEIQGASVAAASSCNIWAQDGNSRHLTGNTDIDDFGTAPQAGAWMKLIANGTAKLKQSTNLNVNGGGLDVILEVGDIIFVYADTSVQMDVFVIRKSGRQVALTATTKQIAQIQTFGTSTVATGTTIIPYDNTIPQLTEGDQYLSISITPQNINSTLEIDVTLELAGSSAYDATVALFQDANSNAIAATHLSHNANYAQVVNFKHLMLAGLITTTTFKVRAGTGTAMTMTVNGAGGGQKLGGVEASRITVKEYLP